VAYQVRRVVELRITVADRPGALAEFLRALREAGAGLLALAAWATDGQAVFAGVPENLTQVRQLALQGSLALQERPALYVEGDNETGALVPITDKLAAAGVDLAAVFAVAAGERYAAILIPKEPYYEAACQALGL
jgi:hypothetical protein